MESEDDMHDANEVESADDDFYSGMDSEGDNDFDYDPVDYDYFGNEIDESEEVIESRGQKNFTILKEEDIHQRQEDEIMRIATVLSVSREAACILLRRYNWSVNNVHEEWFADEDRVRKAVGLLEKRVVEFSKSKEVVYFLQ